MTAPTRAAVMLVLRLLGLSPNKSVGKPRKMLVKAVRRRARSLDMILIFSLPFSSPRMRTTLSGTTKLAPSKAQSSTMTPGLPPTKLGRLRRCPQLSMGRCSWCSGVMGHGSLKKDVAIDGKPGDYGVAWQFSIDTIVHLTSTAFAQRGFYVSKAFSVQHMELAAICWSLDISLKLKSERQLDRCKMIIFPDSVNSLDQIKLGIHHGKGSLYEAHT
ncbi:hypothetical protein QBC36DRAFT_136034 [Triangularia setosa]|uniref:RNase H type-1 domain-containing protein n=1 Tax=Triangularia setosa TaxID=2587417 RepID=A0AAN6WA60_9PEZI|nr:hypothetical protein QBC36DRAFT_136034 [Podospora setosa]